MAENEPENEPKCEECGFSIYSDTHRRGIGIHGHESTTKAVADEQRAEVFARAAAFMERLDEEATPHRRMKAK